MASITCTHDTLIVVMEGLDRLWALKSRIDVRLERVEHIEHDPSVGFPGLIHIRMPGTYVPGIIAAGTFYGNGNRTFWNVRNPARAVVITLRDGQYDRLIIEVEEPDETVRQVREALANFQVRAGGSG